MLMIALYLLNEKSPRIRLPQKYHTWWNFPPPCSTCNKSEYPWLFITLAPIYFWAKFTVMGNYNQLPSMLIKAHRIGQRTMFYWNPIQKNMHMPRWCSTYQHLDVVVLKCYKDHDCACESNLLRTKTSTWLIWYGMPTIHIKWKATQKCVTINIKKMNSNVKRTHWLVIFHHTNGEPKIENIRKTLNLYIHTYVHTQNTRSI